VIDNPQIIVAVAMSAGWGYAVYGAMGASGVGAAVAAGAAGGFVGGLVASGGDLEAAAIGGLTGAAFGYIGGSGAFGNPGAVGAKRIIAHGVVGGTSAELQGGKFGSGFYSAAFAKYGSKYVSNNVAAGTATTAVIGGTASKLTGGKFANGAVTAAWGYLFNHVLSAGVNLRAPRWATRLYERLTGQEVIGKGLSAGVLISAPSWKLVDGKYYLIGEYDVGFYVEGQVGGHDFGVGRAALTVTGSTHTSIRDFAGDSYQYGGHIGTFGGGLSFDHEFQNYGFELSVGKGFNLGGTAAITTTYSLRHGESYRYDVNR
jgi:hypothetical protein